MFDLNELVARARKWNGSVPTMGDLKEWVFDQPWDEFNWRDALPPFTPGEAYSRNIATLEPFEVALLHWKPGVESAVHRHEGFWGFVVCLSGQLEHHGFELRGERLIQSDRVVAFEGGVLAEPDGTIHRLVNGSLTDPLVTLHVYAPALRNLGGLKLFDLERGDVYTCKPSAPAADLSISDVHFESIQRGRFKLMPPSAEVSHAIVPVVPKPDSGSITRLLASYYQAQATNYDRLDQSDHRRHAYTRGINMCIAQRIKELHAVQPVHRVLDVGCGTGRRALEIQGGSGIPYAVYGTDLSREMAAIAAGRGIDVRMGYWEGESGLTNLDAITFLYAFSHISTLEERMGALKRLFQTLRPGGMLFVDVFNREDEYEWGPQVVENYNKWYLGEQGYDFGDVFYARTGSIELAFLHYTRMGEMTQLLASAGFEEIECMRIGYAHEPGQEVEEGGSLMFFAKRPNHE